MRLIISLLVVFLASCSQAPKQADDAYKTLFPQPVASANEQRSFRYLTLPNALPVLLVSDSKADKAAASLDVAVGSGDDPLDRLGLAHYLEHMLFLGTQKYPEADDYQQFIASHAGSQNAYTSFDHTNYFFDVAAQHLEPALDRFAQFFIAPSFDPRYVEREINAVHSEYSSKMLDDFRRGYDVFKTQLNPAHPMAKFSVGSLQTLAGNGDYDALRAQLIAFYQQHYSANKMRLVVYGAESLDQLEAWVAEKFSAIPNYEREPVVINLPLFVDGTLPLSVEILPHREIRQLTMSFALPDVSHEYRSKPLSYIGNILGHEGEGSLLSFLKGKGWVDALSAGASMSYAGGSMFAISMDLTPVGEARIDDIVATVFSAIAMLRDEGIQHALFLEQATVAEQSFATREPQSPIGEASQWASDMHDFEAQDILRGHYLYQDFDAARIRELLSEMQPQHLLLTLVSPNTKADKTSPYFAAPYRAEPIDSLRLQQWQTVAPIPAIKPPAANPFIGEHRLVDIEPEWAGSPQLMINEPALQVWFAQDNLFRVPKGQIIVRLSRPAMGQLSPRDSVLMSMYARLVNDRLTEFAYPAQMAGVSFNVGGSVKGLDINLGGFSSGHNVLFGEVLDSLMQFNVDDARFMRLKQDMLEDLRRTLIDKPFRQIMRRAQQLLMSPSSNIEENVLALESINAVDLSQYAREFSGQWQVEALFFGNYNANAVRLFADQLGAILPKKRDAFSPPVVVVNELDCSVECAGEFVVQDNDSAVLMYLQGENASDQSRVDMAILANMMQSPFFQSLRTEQQLGYIVGAYPFALHSYPGLALLVQSPSASHKDIIEAIDSFNVSFLQRPDGDLCEAFSLSAGAVVAQLLEKPKNLNEQSLDYWQDIQYGELSFDSKARLAEVALQRQCSDWRAVAQNILQTSYKKRLLLSALGKNSTAVIKNISTSGWRAHSVGRNSDKN